MKKILIFWISIILLNFTLISQDDKVNVIDVIKKHGLEESQIAKTASLMTDVYGPRLTGSPMLDKATEWAQDQLKEWGLENIHLDEWGPFGRGWELEHFDIHATAPSYFPIIGYPKAWSSSAENVKGEVIVLDISSEEDFEKYKGKLAGKFVMQDTIRDTKEWYKGSGSRHDEVSLLRMANAGKPTPRSRNYSRYNRSGFNLTRALYKFIEEEKPLAVIDRSYKGDFGTVFVSGARIGQGKSVRDEGVFVTPQLTMSVEHYNRIYRMVNMGIPVSISMNLKTKYTNPDGMEHNIIAEIPGTDLKDEVVMFGAHFDSWHTGTGATDNGAGSSVMMEAARILQETIAETGIKPRRTLRIALWTGEEQGLYGSRAYVKKHISSTDRFGNQEESIENPEKVSGYFNLDNGTGKIRGVYLQGNENVLPIFREWLEPFGELDASTLTMNNTGGTDHLAFDGVGVPGFQFIQDPISYSTRTHHSNMDTYDHLEIEDLKQAATIVAAFVWNTSQRDEMLPRKVKTINP